MSKSRRWSKRSRRENAKHGLDSPTFVPNTGYGSGPTVERPEMLNKPSAKLVAEWERKLRRKT